MESGWKNYEMSQTKLEVTGGHNSPTEFGQ